MMVITISHVGWGERDYHGNRTREKKQVAYAYGGNTARVAILGVMAAEIKKKKKKKKPGDHSSVPLRRRQTALCVCVCDALANPHTRVCIMCVYTQLCA